MAQTNECPKVITTEEELNEALGINGVAKNDSEDDDLDDYVSSDESNCEPEGHSGGGYEI